MDNLTDEEIFLRGIKASGKVINENYSERQQGVFVGVTIGLVMSRENLSGKEAYDKAHRLRESLYRKWVQGELKEPKSVS